LSKRGNSAKIHPGLGFIWGIPVESGLRKTVECCLANEIWCQRVADGRYRGERLGLVK
jgi:dTDP-glucose 4,6-dehydratase